MNHSKFPGNELRSDSGVAADTHGSTGRRYGIIKPEALGSMCPKALGFYRNHYISHTHRGHKINRSCQTPSTSGINRHVGLIEAIEAELEQKPITLSSTGWPG